MDSRDYTNSHRSPDRRREDERYSEHRRRDERFRSDKDNHRRRNTSRSRSPYREQRREQKASISRSPSPRPRHDDRARRRHRPSRKRSTSRSRSPPRKKRAQDSPASPAPLSRKALPSQDAAYRGEGAAAEGAVALAEPKEKANFKTTGLLAAETNKVIVGSGMNSQAVVLKYHEPPEARKPPPSAAWVMYIFKGASPDPLETIPLHLRSCWLLGREAAVADILVEHPSLSKQHAVFQFRYVVSKDQYGEKKGKVALYILDLESVNGTWLNGKRIEAARYVECFTGDVLKLGLSEREYVILLPPKEGSK